MDLILIRHPAPATDAGVCYGKTDVALAEDASASAVAMAARLAALHAPPARALWSSPLVRCSSVAARLARHFGCAETLDARLQEIDFGTWERMRWDEIDRAEIDAWAADLQHARTHGGESVAQFNARVREWFETCVAPADASCHVVTHAGVMRAIASFALRVPHEQCLQWALDMAGIVWLRRHAASGDWALVRWNA
ncbi:alpha-ribazole phosphatase [Trinickia terrae]|uniref:Alpha-ribazole phosphatase n=1 Tax=Trinickia terrae TaxID=2571161 RepID=A0A4U1HVR5_9BURK|nr:alpha-ribazole phosphatase [Trinickia terrae]TKC83026.1 alpha-ribazole phosphatase [Trinickia terrae]